MKNVYTFLMMVVLLVVVATIPYTLQAGIAPVIMNPYTTNSQVSADAHVQSMIPSTNGFVDQTITNGLAPIVLVTTMSNAIIAQIPSTNGFVDQTITNGLASTTYIDASISNAVYVISTNTTTFVTTNDLRQLLFTNDANIFGGMGSLLTSLSGYNIMPGTIETNMLTTNAYLALISNNRVTYADLDATNTALMLSIDATSNSIVAQIPTTNDYIIPLTFQSDTNIYALDTLYTNTGNAGLIVGWILFNNGAGTQAVISLNVTNNGLGSSIHIGGDYLPSSVPTPSHPFSFPVNSGATFMFHHLTSGTCVLDAHLWRF